MKLGRTYKPEIKMGIGIHAHSHLSFTQKGLSQMAMASNYS
jgi:hypothetical protein